MARLPKPGGDAGAWGELLNDYLSVEHNDDGTLKRGDEIDQAKSDIADLEAGTYTKSEIDTALDAKLDRADVSSLPQASIVFVLDGNGAPLDFTVSGEMVIPFAGTITGWKVLAPESGSLVTTVNKASWAAYPTMSPISGSQPPALTSATLARDDNLTDWQVTIDADDILQIPIVSADNLTQATIVLSILRSQGAS